MKSIKLVFLIALKQEIPDFLVATKGCVVTSLKALLAGDQRVFSNLESSVLTIITGVGKACSMAASHWVKTHLNPYQVINLGCAGSQSLELVIGDIVIAKSVSLQGSMPITCLDRLPVLGKQLSSLPLVSVGSVENIGDFHDTAVIDMEAYWQATVFKDTAIAYSSLKYISDINDTQSLAHVPQHLPAMRQSFNQLFEPIIRRLTSPLDYSISVVIPTYNRANFVVRAIRSVLDQTYPCKCIVVDDASTDDTLDQLRCFNDRIELISLPNNKGVSNARNQGILAAKTPWVAFLDSDDEWQPDMLKTQVTYLQHHPLFDICQCDELWVRNGVVKQKKSYHQKQAGWIFSASLERCLISPSAVLLSKQLLETYQGFNESLPACEDYDLWCHITRDYPIGFTGNIGITKYAGHNHQLSEYPFLDQYRIKTLQKVLAQESNFYYHDIIESVLRRKQQIVSQGKRKRLDRSK